MDYGEYLDQLTYLLFLKMADERSLDLPLGTGWGELVASADDRLLSSYGRMLARLKESDGLVGDIFSASASAFSHAESLRRVIRLLDQVKWASLPSDVQADAFEYLLEQAAAEGKKGAGQYFTPRALIESIVACMRPGALATDRLVSDPAAGTGGFLVAAHMWAETNIMTASPNPTMRRLKYHGTELVARPRRLGLMNLMLHGVNEPRIDHADAIYGDPSTELYDVILTNPPFGAKGGQPPFRPEFWARTGIKQINFAQHVVHTLRDGGRAAIVLPDNCFFGDGARILWPELVQRCDVHTVLRLPVGTFAPYTAGTKTNVVFLTKGRPTNGIWIYDARSGMQPASKLRPLTANTLAEFEVCYGPDPTGMSPRDRDQSSVGRWNAFSAAELGKCGFEPDRLPWRAGTKYGNQRTPAGFLLGDILIDLDAAAEDVRTLIKELED